MAKKIYAKCTNIEGDCTVAKSGKLLDFPAGTSAEDLICPECSEQLFEVKPPGVPILEILKKALLIVLPVLLLGGGAWYMLAGDDTIVIEKPGPPIDSTVVVAPIGNSIPKSINSPGEIVKPIPPKENPKPHIKEPVTKSTTAYGKEVPNSRRTVDCDILFQIWDGNGGKLDQIKKLAGCDCGTEQTFKSGFKYLIDCESGSKRAKLVASN